MSSIVASSLCERNFAKNNPIVCYPCALKPKTTLVRYNNKDSLLFVKCRKLKGRILLFCIEEVIFRREKYKEKSDGRKSDCARKNIAR